MAAHDFVGLEASSPGAISRNDSDIDAMYGHSQTAGSEMVQVSVPSRPPGSSSNNRNDVDDEGIANALSKLHVQHDAANENAKGAKKTLTLLLWLYVILLSTYAAVVSTRNMLALSDCACGGGEASVAEAQLEAGFCDQISICLPIDPSYSNYSTSINPSSDPTDGPSTSGPSANPTSDPTIGPSANPTVEPNITPTMEPTLKPTQWPTTEPTADPTQVPTADPTRAPMVDPTADPTQVPTAGPTANPTSEPTPSPTGVPTNTVSSAEILPQNAIVIWSDCAHIPDGWILCTGSNGTPDLQGRFVVGAGTSSSGTTFIFGESGGSSTHSHTISTSVSGTVGGTALSIAQMPSHNHANGNYKYLSRVNECGNTVHEVDATCNEPDLISVGSIQLQGSGQTHTHGLSLQHSASASSTSQLPPYYTLCYIMKDETQTWVETRG